MNKAWLTRCVMLGLFVLGTFGSELAFAQNNVTFQVRMSIKMREGTFRPDLGDIVAVPGDFNSWSTSADTLRDPDGDSIYTVTKSLPTGGITYKFYKSLRGGIDWEGDPNRTYTVVAGSQTIPAVWFDRDSVYNPPTTNVPVTFQVNMRVKMLEGTFRPDLGDFVRVPGSFNGWNTNVDTLRDPDVDSIYTKTIMIAEGANIQYKFFKTPRGGIDWEGDPNRQYTVPTGGGTIPVVYFDRDSVVSIPINANILWNTDMTAFLQLGWFVPAQLDTMQVRGGFNGWGGTIMALDPFSTATYNVTLPYSGTSFDNLPHKYYIDMDSANAVIRFPDFNADQDGHRYEHPYDRGDGNRILNVGNGGNITATPYYYSSIHPFGVVNQTDTVTVTFRVNMGPATRSPFSFVPGTDTVKFNHRDPLWVSAQKRIQPSFVTTRTMTAVPGTGDTVYQVSITLRGRTHYGLMYGYSYHQPGGTSESEGAGLGAQGGYRVRFIQPLGPNSFPRNYSAPQDTWIGPPPLPGESAPFSTTGVETGPELGQPLAYKLYQNYPNPFNPTTKIFYSLPEQARVSLKVYNILGQEVATLVNDQQPQGNYVALFEPQGLSTGVYFYRLEAGSFRETKKMVFVK